MVLIGVVTFFLMSTRGHSGGYGHLASRSAPVPLWSLALPSYTSTFKPDAPQVVRDVSRGARCEIQTPARQRNCQQDEPFNTRHPPSTPHEQEDDQDHRGQSAQRGHRHHVDHVSPGPPSLGRQPPDPRGAARRLVGRQQGGLVAAPHRDGERLAGDLSRGASDRVGQPISAGSGSVRPASTGKVHSAGR